MKNYDPIVAPMLEDGLKAMIYAGQEDLICNWLGNQARLDIQYLLRFVTPAWPQQLAPCSAGSTHCPGAAMTSL